MHCKNSLRILWCGLSMLGLIVCLATGCGKNAERVAVFPVSGQVKFQGEPCEGAIVRLVPKSDVGIDKHFAFATTDAQGAFTLTTYETGDGAPAGEYSVVVIWPESPRGPSADRLQGRYKDPQASKIVAVVKEEPTELPVWNLE